MWVIIFHALLQIDEENNIISVRVFNLLIKLMRKNYQ